MSSSNHPLAAPDTAARPPVEPVPRMDLAERVADPAHRAISLALWVSAIRCTLLYVVLPVLGPVLHLASSPAWPLWVALHAVGLSTSGRALHRAVVRRQRTLITVSGVLLAVNVVSLLVR